MPWTIIESHGVDIDVSKCAETNVYVVELFKSLDTVATTRPTSSCSPRHCITTNVGTTLLLENDYVKVWEFSLPPNRKSHMHCHVNNYMFINLIHSKTRGMNEKWQYATPTSVQEAGQVTYVNLQGNEAIHAAENVADSTFQQLIVEFKR